MYNDEFRFPLAEGDLDQPGVSASVTRKITIKKRKAAEAVEIEEVKQQEADAKRRKEQGIPDDPPSSCLDFWTCNNEVLIRHHRTPRTTLYVPTEDECPVPLKWIDVTRFTQTSLDGASNNTIDDLWITNDATDLTEYWTGRTRFHLLKPAPPKGWNWQEVRLTKG